jgi:hypothetical protein
MLYQDFTNFVEVHLEFCPMGTVAVRSACALYEADRPAQNNTELKTA